MGSSSVDVQSSSSWVFQSEEEEVEGQIQAWHLSHALIASMATRNACKLGLPDILAKEGVPLTLEEIASHLGSSNKDYLFRLLRYLCTKGFFSCDSELKYGLTPASKWMLQEPPGPGLSLAPMLQLMSDGRHAAFWDCLSDCVLHGGTPYERALGAGVDPWKVSQKDPYFNHLFNSAMACTTQICMNALLKHYQGFAAVAKLVDVGGGVGMAASLIVARYPSIQAINLDLPHVIAEAPPYPGVEHVSGDMFKTIPSSDTIFLKWILHDWGDEDCVKILKNCLKALPPKNGKIIIVEAILDTDSPFNEMAIVLDMAMAFTTQGQERTKEQWKSLLEHAGFPHHNIIKLPCLQYVIEAFPESK